jgi:glutamine synthetase
VAYGNEALPALPKRLGESIAAFEQDKALQELLHPEFVRLVTAVKRHEEELARTRCNDYDSPLFNARVDPREWDYYLELL